MDKLDFIPEKEHLDKRIHYAFTKIINNKKGVPFGVFNTPVLITKQMIEKCNQSTVINYPKLLVVLQHIASCQGDTVVIFSPRKGKSFVCMKTDKTSLYNKTELNWFDIKTSDMEDNLKENVFKNRGIIGHAVLITIYY